MLTINNFYIQKGSPYGLPFERPNEDGFDLARCILPTYTWIKREGFADKESEKFDRFLYANAHLLYKYAASGGIKIA